MQKRLLNKGPSSDSRRWLAFKAASVSRLPYPFTAWTWALQALPTAVRAPLPVLP